MTQSSTKTFCYLYVCLGVCFYNLKNKTSSDSEICDSDDLFDHVFFHFSSLYKYRKYKLEAELANMAWKIKWEDISFSKGAGKLAGSRRSLGSVSIS